MNHANIWSLATVLTEIEGIQCTRLQILDVPPFLKKIGCCLSSKVRIVIGSFIKFIELTWDDNLQAQALWVGSRVGRGLILAEMPVFRKFSDFRKFCPCFSWNFFEYFMKFWTYTVMTGISVLAYYIIWGCTALVGCFFTRNPQTWVPLSSWRSQARVCYVE